MKRDIISLEVTPMERKRIEQLAALTGQSMKALILTCIKYSGGAVRKRYIKDFVANALEVMDPFGQGENDYALPIDEADRLLAEQTAHEKAPLLSAEQKRIAIEADMRVGRIWWLMSGPDQDIPEADRIDVLYWREHEAELRKLRTAINKRKAKQC